jgi:hypothetical protein
VKPCYLRVARVVITLAVGVLSSAVAIHSFMVVHDSDRLPVCDAAKNGFESHRFALDICHGRPVEALRHLNEQGQWPFAYSLLQFPFLVAGEWTGLSSFTSASLLSGACFAVIPLLLLSIAFSADCGWRGIFAGALAAGIFLTSPVFRLYALLIMRELPGVALTLSSFMAYSRARRIGSCGAYCLASVVALLLFFLKYNYGLIWIVSVVVVEVAELSVTSRRRLLDWLKGLVLPLGRGSLFTRVRCVGLTIYVGLLVTCGLLWGEFAGTLLYPAFVIGAAMLLYAVFLHGRGLLQWWSGLEGKYRAALALFVAPVWCWNLIPDHSRSFVAALLGRTVQHGKAVGWSVDNLVMLYPRGWVYDYGPPTGVSFLILAGVLFSLVRIPREDGTSRLLWIVSMCGLALAFLHPHREMRFLLTIAPFLILLMAVKVSRWCALLSTSAMGRTAGGAVAAALLLLLIGSGRRSIGVTPLLREAYLNNTVEEVYRPCLPFIMRHVDWDSPVSVVGASNELSKYLIVWYAQQRRAEGVRLDRTPVAQLLRGESASRWERWFYPWVATPVQQVVAVRILPASAEYRRRDYQMLDAWQQGIVNGLCAADNWTVIASQVFREAGVEILILCGSRG